MPVKLKKAPADLRPSQCELFGRTQRFRVEGTCYLVADGALALHETPNLIYTGYDPATRETHVTGEASGHHGYYTVTHVPSGRSLRHYIPGQKLARAYLEALMERLAKALPEATWATLDPTATVTRIVLTEIDRAAIVEAKFQVERAKAKKEEDAAHAPND